MNRKPILPMGQWWMRIADSLSGGTERLGPGQPERSAYRLVVRSNLRAG